MRLLVVSHTPHYIRDGRLVGWGPTVREISYLAELFDELVHVAPVYDGPAPESALPYGSPRVVLRAVKAAGGLRLDQKLGILAQYPEYARVIRRELSTADAVHVRCPANISLLTLGLLMRSEKPAYRWVKYAGNWQPDGVDPWSYRLQRDWLAKNRHRGVVTINGCWADQPEHVFSFNNPSLTEDELTEGRLAGAQRRLTSPVKLLYVGTLNDAKGAGRVLEVARRLAEMGVPFHLQMVGDGPDRARYEQYVVDYAIQTVEFCGWVSRDAMGSYYGGAHFILLPSRSEGWPKVLSEGMAYGVVGIAGAVSGIPQVMEETGAGVALSYTDTGGMADVIVGYLAEPGQWLAASRAGMDAADRFGYAHYQQAVTELFEQMWGIRLATPEPDALALGRLAGGS